MRILCEAQQSKENMILGWKSACEAAGFGFTIWDPKTKPAFDAFDEIDPYVFIMTDPALTMHRGLLRVLTKRSNSTKTIDGTKSLPAFDSINLRPGIHRPELESDALFIGNYDEQKLTRFLLPIIGKYRLKILGNTIWPVSEYLGSVSIKSLPDLIASTQVCLDVSIGERQTPERIYQYLGLGGIVLSNRCYGITAPNPYYPSESLPCLEVEKEPVEFEETLDYLVHEARMGEGSHWQTQARRGRSVVLSQHTYRHRVAEMFKSVGLEREAGLIMEGAGGWV